MEFLNLKQNEKSVAEYEAKFIKLSRYGLHLVSKENRKAHMSEKDLKSSTRHKIVPFDLVTFEEVSRKAHIVERETHRVIAIQKTQI